MHSYISMIRLFIIVSHMSLMSHLVLAQENRLEEPINKPAVDSLDQPTNEPDDQPANEPDDQPTNEPDDQPTNEPEEQLTNDSQFFDMTLEELLDVDLSKHKEKKAALYGFVRANVERVLHVPVEGSNGRTSFGNDPIEWNQPSFNLYGTASPFDNVSVLFNLAGSTDKIEVCNAYGNFMFEKRAQVRFGRMYRRFGLFNDKLDQFPTFLGIESPELFDSDHLLLPRTTNFAIHGEQPFGDFRLQYFVDTGNGEAGPQHKIYPLGWDLRIKGRMLVVGTSGYLSNLNDNKTSSTVKLGEGSPSGGVMPWMRGDRYLVLGGFVEFGWDHLIIRGAYWISTHDGERNPEAVLTVVRKADINQKKRERFLGANASTPDTDLTEADVVTEIDYTIHTFYFRFGYSVFTKVGTLTPYLFIDYMSHPETIRNKTYGGDNEAGLADNGRFWKPSLGLVFKPKDELALKLDASAHIQVFNESTEIYPEVRFDVSFAFKLIDK